MRNTSAQVIPHWRRRIGLTALAVWAAAMTQVGSGAAETVTVRPAECAAYTSDEGVDHAADEGVNLTPQPPPSAQVRIERPVGDPDDGGFVPLTIDVAAGRLSGFGSEPIDLNRDPAGACAEVVQAEAPEDE
ncbi:MAG: hypothetical protein AAGL49_01135 [Pseudomonadota bacterium]